MSKEQYFEGYEKMRKEQENRIAKLQGVEKVIHELKTTPEYFQAVWMGDKNFEVRKNDRDFKVGDSLLLKEYNPITQEYTGMICKQRIKYILSDPEYVKEGYVILGMWR